MSWKIIWGLQTDEWNRHIRAFVRVATPAGRILRERYASYRPMTLSERSYMESPLTDPALEYRMARQFFPGPEAFEGIGGPLDLALSE